MDEGARLIAQVVFIAGAFTLVAVTTWLLMLLREEPDDDERNR